jgi:phage terminase large subunit
MILMGGRGAGRSTVASQFALAKLRNTDSYFRCAIMRFVLGDIRNSIFQDIYDRIDELDLKDDVTIKEQMLSFKLGKNVINGIGFRKSSSEQKSKMKSLANYNVVIIEEADEVSEEDFMQLDDSLRTLKSDVMIILLLNTPPKNHWINKRWFNLLPSGVEGYYLPVLKESERHNTCHIMTNFRDNLANLNDTTIANFERYKETKPDHYYNMIEGLVPEGARGRIFKNWTPTTNEVFDKLPFPSIYGLDYGFTNDPTALIEIKKHNNKVWFRELIYETGLTNTLISKRLNQLGIPKHAKIYGDSAEPKSNQELRDDGWNVIDAEKGPDSVRAGIDMMLDFEVFYTEDSVNIAREQQEYKWALDKNKEPTNDPIDDFNHGMDAERYGLWTDSKQGFVGFV